MSYPEFKEVYRDDKVIVEHNIISDISINFISGDEKEHKLLILPYHTQLQVEQKRGQYFNILDFKGDSIAEGELNLKGERDEYQEKLTDAIIKIDNEQVWDEEMYELFLKLATDIK